MYSKGDYDSLNNYFLSCNFSVLFHSSNTAEEIWEILEHHIITGMHIYIASYIYS